MINRITVPTLALYGWACMAVANTGFGIALVKKFILAMGGRVEAAGIPGAGWLAPQLPMIQINPALKAVNSVMSAHSTKPPSRHRRICAPEIMRRPHRKMSPPLRPNRNRSIPAPRGRS